MIIQVAARTSPLSRAQVEEILEEIRKFHPETVFETVFAATVGDRDQQTSLRTLGKTDFFTKEIDALVLEGICQIGIHSAKDLPDSIPSELAIAAITQGVDSSDALVLRNGITLETLPQKALIATSSERREESVRQLRKDFRFCDLRGPIHERIAKLDRGEADGVVVAEAALIRLGLTHLNRIRLPGETVPGQGRLAIISRKDNVEMLKYFNCLDTRS